MTGSVTGVVWTPRGAAANATTLASGAGPVPLDVASSAWNALAEGFADAAATLTRVTGELRAGWEGRAADAALARIAPFGAWMRQTAALAAATASRASAEAGAYTTATLSMPSVAEIAAAQSATSAAYTAGGALTGSAAATETVEHALDVRAGQVMDAYEAASTTTAAPGTFTAPPLLTNDAAAQTTAQVGPTSGADVRNAAAVTGTPPGHTGADTTRSDTDAHRTATTGGAPAGPHRGSADADAAARPVPGYLRHFEHFADGRTVIPSVIGADPDGDRL